MTVETHIAPGSRLTHGFRLGPKMLRVTRLVQGARPMAKPQRIIPADMLVEPLARAKHLAEKMARVLNNEEQSDVAVAVALLTSGVVNHYAGDPAKANELMTKIRGLEDRLLTKSLQAGDLRMQ